MPKRPVKDRDFAVNALRVVEQAIGEHMDGTALDTAQKKSPSAANGKIGGKRGGPARAKVLTADQKRQIAVKAAQTRWKKQKDG
jgi:hypothetical protein